MLGQCQAQCPLVCVRPFMKPMAGNVLVDSMPHDESTNEVNCPQMPGARCDVLEGATRSEGHRY